MKNRKVYLIAVILAAAAVIVFALTRKDNPEFRNQTPVSKAETSTTAVPEEVTVLPEKTDAATADVPEDEAHQTAENNEKEQPFLVQITEDDPAIAYVLVRMNGFAGFLPLPTEGEYTRPIRQMSADGKEAGNVRHLTTNGFWMEEANCEGQDCVKEWEVTLENREERVLWNMVICLPHQLSAELITREEAEQILK